MRVTRSVFGFGLLTVALAVMAGGCAAKKAQPSSEPEVVAPPKPSVPATPPKHLAMNVDLTPPQAPPKPPPPKPPPPAPPPPKTEVAETVKPRPSDPCATLNQALGTALVHFDRDQATISDAAEGEVERISAAIKSSGLGTTGEFSLEGHCDATGSDGYNVTLSERRARIVLDRLVVLGALKADRATAVGRGKQQPLDPASTPEAYAKNRRVSVVAQCAAR